MPQGTLTGVNTVLMLSVPLVFPQPQQLQEFATDDVYDIPTIRSVEVQMGVDGVLSAGFVLVAIPMTITLQGNSPSNAVFDTWWSQMQAAKDDYPATGLIRLPTIQTKFMMVGGHLTGYKPAPGVKKLIQPRQFEITWQAIQPSPT